MKSRKLPQTDSIEKLARFWDTHDLTDFEDQLEEVSEPVFERASPIRVHLPPNDAMAVERLAKTKGVSKAELIREWVRQKIAGGAGEPKRRQR